MKDLSAECYKILKERDRLKHSKFVAKFGFRICFHFNIQPGKEGWFGRMQFVFGFIVSRLFLLFFQSLLLATEPWKHCFFNFNSVILFHTRQLWSCNGYGSTHLFLQVGSRAYQEIEPNIYKRNPFQTIQGSCAHMQSNMSEMILDYMHIAERDWLIRLFNGMSTPLWVI